MHRASSIVKLDPRIREEVDRALREGRATIEEIVALIKSQGGAASRSAVGRYAKSAREQMERYRQAQEVAKVWVAKLGEEPQGDVGRLLIEMLRTISFQTLAQIGEGEKGANAMEVMLLAKAMDHIAKASKASVEHELKVDQLLKARVEKAAADIEQKVDAQTQGGKALTAEAFKRLVREAYGG